MKINARNTVQRRENARLSKREKSGAFHRSLCATFLASSTPLFNYPVGASVAFVANDCIQLFPLATERSILIAQGKRVTHASYPRSRADRVFTVAVSISTMINENSPSHVHSLLNALKHMVLERSPHVRSAATTFSLSLIGRRVSVDHRNLS